MLLATTGKFNPSKFDEAMQGGMYAWLTALVVNVVAVRFPTMEVTQLANQPISQLEELFKHGSAESMPLGLAHGTVIRSYLSEDDSRQTFYRNPLWAGNFYQKTRCNGHDMNLMFTLIKTEQVGALIANFLPPGLVKSSLQAQLATARVTLGRVGDLGMGDFALDDKQSILVNFGVTPDDCRDNNWGEVSMQAFANIDPIRRLRTEMRQVALDNERRRLFLARVFEDNNGRKARVQWETLLFEP